MFVLIRLLSSVRGLGTYASLSVCFPGLSLALLYMTVLSFDSVTRGKYLNQIYDYRKLIFIAYVIEQGLSEVVLGILNGLGSIFGIIGTLVYPILVKRTGLVRTGVIGFWSEFSVLILCLLSLFVYGTSFTPFQYFTIGSCHHYGTTNTNSTVNTNITVNTNSTINSIPYHCSNSKLSVLLLVIGITLNRFGNGFLPMNFYLLFFCC
jgi:iron-regulated transporter 1